MSARPDRITEPQQERSRRTLDALLNATADLLDENPFSEVSISNIVKKANSSAGSFYARFEDKNALMHALHQRFVERAFAQTQEAMSDLQGEKQPLEKVVARIIDGVVDIYLGHRGVIRAAMIEALVDDQYAHRAFGLMNKVSVLMASVVEAEGLSQEDLCQKMENGVRTLTAILEQQLFFDAVLQKHRKLGDENSALNPDRLARVFLASANINCKS